MCLIKGLHWNKKEVFAIQVWRKESKDLGLVIVEKNDVTVLSTKRFNGKADPEGIRKPETQFRISLFSTWKDI